MTFDAKDIKAAVYGGAILGGGGGGDLSTGLDFGNMAYQYGYPRFAELSTMPEDGILVTVALVGAPAAEERFVKPRDYVESVRLLIESLDQDVVGIITNENGGATTVNGLLQSAVLDLPVVDAPCNGRAHPIGTMGSMGLHELSDYTAVQAACGGNPDQDNYHEIQVKGPLSKCANIIREISVSAGGLVAVARNPVTVKYVRANGAVGAISQAIKVGENMLKNESQGPLEMAEGAAEALSGSVIVSAGSVKSRKLETTGGFDVGTAVIEDEQKGTFELTFWNEYMTLEQGGDRLATFPDLIMTVSLEDGQPVTTAQLKEGDRVAVITSELENLYLGAGMYYHDLYQKAEEAVDKQLIPYLKGRVI